MYQDRARPGLTGATSLDANALAFDALSRREWQVVRLAKREADRGRWEAATAASGTPGLVARLVRAVTGIAPATGLADERLETLRRFVALSRRGDERAQPVVTMLLGLGYAPEAIAMARAAAIS